MFLNNAKNFTGESFLHVSQDDIQELYAAGRGQLPPDLLQHHHLHVLEVCHGDGAVSVDDKEMEGEWVRIM